MSKKNPNFTYGSSRRSNIEIWSEFLESCTKTPRTQTWLRRNLRIKTSSFNGAKQFLISRGLIKEQNNFGSIEYVTTEKGEEALFQYYNLITKFFAKKKEGRI